MGDRTIVTLTVLKEHQQEAIDLIDSEQGQPSDIDTQNDETVTLTYVEVNYGTIENLPALVRAGIPYSFQWGSGGSYCEGEEHLRFNADGTNVLISFYMDWPANIICECMETIKGHADPESALQELLNQYQEPSWDYQLEHSNMARATNLIQQ